MDIGLEINEDIFFKQGECNVLYSINAKALPMTLYIYILHASVTRISCCGQFLLRYSLK